MEGQIGPLALIGLIGLALAYKGFRNCWSPHLNGGDMLDAMYFIGGTCVAAVAMAGALVVASHS